MIAPVVSITGWNADATYRKPEQACATVLLPLFPVAQPNRRRRDERGMIVLARIVQMVLPIPSNSYRLLCAVNYSLIVEIGLSSGRRFDQG
ncbi:hypothetical protein [Massilia sp. TN1-12]|uniref:hypothetical protein n=1 Tax=Massilia paldalensis TaxID=3377675 RepID=UPI00384DF676